MFRKNDKEGYERLERCYDCKGCGREEKNCDKCNGIGGTHEIRDGHRVALTCQNCRSGKVIVECRSCNGTGQNN